MNAGMSVEQLVAAREAEAEAATRKAAEADDGGKSGTEANTVGAPAGDVLPAGERAASMETMKTASLA